MKIIGISRNQLYKGFFMKFVQIKLLLLASTLFVATSCDCFKKCKTEDKPTEVAQISQQDEATNTLVAENDSVEVASEVAPVEASVEDAPAAVPVEEAPVVAPVAAPVEAPVAAK